MMPSPHSGRHDSTADTGPRVGCTAAAITTAIASRAQDQATAVQERRRSPTCAPIASEEQPARDDRRRFERAGAPAPRTGPHAASAAASAAPIEDRRPPGCRCRSTPRDVRRVVEHLDQHGRHDREHQRQHEARAARRSAGSRRARARRRARAATPDRTALRSRGSTCAQAARAAEQRPVVADS